MRLIFTDRTGGICLEGTKPEAEDLMIGTHSENTVSGKHSQTQTLGLTVNH